MVERNGKPHGAGSSGDCAAGPPGRAFAERRIVLTAPQRDGRLHASRVCCLAGGRLTFAASMEVLKHRDAGSVELRTTFAATAGPWPCSHPTHVSFAELSNLQTKNGIKQKLAQA